MVTVDKKAFQRMRKDIESFDKERETIIRSSRDVLKQSKNAIYALHRNNIASAKKKIDTAKKTIATINKRIAKDNRLTHVNIYSDALEEYVEASCYYGFLVQKKLPTAATLKVDPHIYIQGVSDLVGELVRKAINSAIDGDATTAMDIRDFVGTLYEELLLFDLRNIPARKKFDAIKYGLEKLEDLALKLKVHKS